MNEELQLQIDQVEQLCTLIEDGQEYMGKLTGCLPALSRTINDLLVSGRDPGNPFKIDELFTVQLLKDILYGIEQEDSVFLLDVLRYGLLEIYYYIKDISQIGANHE